jgi:hypothetical protein
MHRPSVTGSPPIAKTIGIVVFAALAATAEGVSVAAITSTLRRTKSGGGALLRQPCGALIRAMETGNRSDKAKPEPVAWSAAVALQPVKALEDVLALIGGNSGPIVVDRNDGTAIVLSDLYCHPTGHTAVFDGVVHEIGHGVEQEIPVSSDEDASIHDRVEMHTLVFCGCIEKLHHLARDLCQVYGAERRGSIARFDLRYSRQRGEHAQDGIEVRHRVADQRVIMVAVMPAVVSLLQPSAHAGQRRPQIMRHVVGNLLHLRHQRFNPVEHRIEVCRIGCSLAPTRNIQPS